MEPILEFTEYDWERTRQLQEYERIDPLTRENMFDSAVYFLFSATEYYDKQMRVLNRLKGHGLTHPWAIKRNPAKVRDAASIARYGNIKADRLLKLADWWISADWPERVIDDTSNGRDLEFELRKELATARVGLGWKCASLFMRACDYENVAALDVWALRTMNKLGFGLIPPDPRDDRHRIPKEQLGLFESAGIDIPQKSNLPKATGGISGNIYLRFEQEFSEIAERHGITPAMFQLLIYTKYSTVYLPSEMNPRLF